MSVTEGSEYQYCIRAKGAAGGYSGYSETVDATSYPAAPTVLTAAGGGLPELGDATANLVLIRAGHRGREAHVRHARHPG